MDSKVEIVDAPLNIVIYGHSGQAINKDYGAAGFKIMGDMWEKIKSNQLKHKGKNIWIYEQNDKMFTGVELENKPGIDIGLEQKEITLLKYAYYKHIGPYNRLREGYSKIENELNLRGNKACLPFVEIYGHWTDDETKLETEILMNIK